MTTRIIMFTQPGCISCELTRLFFEANEVAIEEHDISRDMDARREMIDDHGSTETPTVVFVFEKSLEVVVGFDPTRLDQLLHAA
ncbi:MAG TPA: glutaredoxin family protein [Candidatus Solibacter sp.]|nr:glutaredoxin family protein [Candidatus Solibacter sp.]